MLSGAPPSWDSRLLQLGRWGLPWPPSWGMRGCHVPWAWLGTGRAPCPPGSLWQLAEHDGGSLRPQAQWACSRRSAPKKCRLLQLRFPAPSGPRRPNQFLKKIRGLCQPDPSLPGQGGLPAQHPKEVIQLPSPGSHQVPPSRQLKKSGPFPEIRDVTKVWGS